MMWTVSELSMSVPVLFVTDVSQLSYPISAVLWTWRVVMDWCPQWRLIQSQPFADVTMWLKRWNTPKDASTLPVWVEQELPINNPLNIRLSWDVIPILVHRVNFLQWHFHSGSQWKPSVSTIPASFSVQTASGCSAALLREKETLVNQMCLFACDDVWFCRAAQLC